MRVVTIMGLCDLILVAGRCLHTNVQRGVEIMCPDVPSKAVNLHELFPDRVQALDAVAQT